MLQGLTDPARQVRVGKGKDVYTILHFTRHDALEGMRGTFARLVIVNQMLDLLAVCSKKLAVQGQECRRDPVLDALARRA